VEDALEEEEERLASLVQEAPLLAEQLKTTSYSSGSSQVLKELSRTLRVAEESMR
jgi:hypothetical protein